MQRREFALALGATAALAALPARAQNEAVEGKTYTRLPQPQPMLVPGKIEVIEFFGYWCPHCNALEPALEAWARKLPPDVNFRRIPVAWQALHEPYQRLYFALEALGLGPGIHAKVFAAVHVQHLRLDMDAGLATFAAANGIDKAKLVDAMRSFSVTAKVNQARQTWAAYGLESVPSLVVGGRYLTQPEGDGAGEAAMRVVDALVRKVAGKG
jgi:thiol:disulfide interchange protein DsbA